MATNTTNLSLIKPAGTDKVRIAQINQNMDIIDEKIGPVGNTSLQAQVNAINPKRPAINSLKSDNYILGLSDGVYQVALNAASGYLPEIYGTLVINRSGSSYGVATFASTTGKTYFRHMNGTSAWHNNEWIRVALNSQIDALNSQLSNTNANDCATVVNSGDAFAARKVGNMLIIDFMGANRTHTEDELLFTLSSGYRPVARTKAVGSISTTPVVIDIAEDGKCTIYLINGATSSARLYFHIVIAI